MGKFFAGLVIGGLGGVVVGASAGALLVGLGVTQDPERFQGIVDRAKATKAERDAKNSARKAA